MQQNNFNNNYGAFGGYTPPAAPNGYYGYGYFPPNFNPKEYEEKKALKRAAWFISLSLIALCVISEIWVYGYIFVMSALGFSYEETINILYEPAVMSVLSIFISMFVFTLPFIIIFKIGKYRISNLVILEKPKKELFLPLTLIGIAFCSLANIATSYTQSIFDLFGVDYSVNYGEDPSGFFGFMLSLISTVIVPAFVEEFACRGIILGVLRKFGDGFAIIASSILFGLMHGNFEQMPFAFMVGLILGFITVKSGSLWIAMFVHGFNNFSSVVLSYALPTFTVQIQNLIYICLTAVYLLLGILGVFILKNKNSEFFNFRKSEITAKEKTKYIWLFTSPFIIVFTGLCVWDSLQFFV